MKEIPTEIIVFYDALLVQKEIPRNFRFYYKKWLRYYLDFCQKYNFKQSDKESLSYFIKKLKEKNQTDQQRKQALDAVSICYQIEKKKNDPDSAQALNNKNENIPTKKSGLKSTNEDWRQIYGALNAEIIMGGRATLSY